MGIRSLLRNVFSRSRAGREEQAPPAAGAAGATDTAGRAGAGDSSGTAVPEQSRAAGEPAPGAGSASDRPDRTAEPATGPAGRPKTDGESGGITADLMSAFDAPRGPAQRTAASEDAKAAPGDKTGGDSGDKAGGKTGDETAPAADTSDTAATATTADSTATAATSGTGPAAEANRAAEEAIAEAGALSTGAVPEPVAGPAAKTAGSPDAAGTGSDDKAGRNLAAEGAAEAKAELDAVDATVAELSGDAPPEPVADAEAEAEAATDGKPAPGTASGAGTAAEEAKAEAASLAGDNDPAARDAEPEQAPAAAEPAAPAAPAAEKTTAAKTTTAARKTATKKTAAPKKEAAPAKEAAPKDEAAPANEAAPTKAPEPEQPAKEGAAGAISLEKVRKTAPGLVNLYKAASTALDKEGLAGQRAAVYLVLDRSGSMRGYYKDGTVQHLAEQALGLSANLDDDGTVPVVFFSTDIDGTADIALDDYKGRIEALHADLGHMGRTNYHRAIETVVEHYKKSGSTAPAFVIFQTDGAPTSKAAAEKALCEAAELPVFWQFIGFGETDAKGFDFLRKLDTLSVPERRKADNAGFFHAGPEPKKLTNRKLYEQLLAEFPTWLAEAREKGILG
ncbi:VWA domain-containing protein [Streptomyces albus]|uniref:vWA domain-containing protein n=1 Tax=Streptomyces albus TaxID=1888 RepID=UPI00099CB53E|nr:VWA domain-containing protein [Streptomyces albus]